MDHTYLARCRVCNGVTSRAFARKHEGKCKACSQPADGSLQELDSNRHEKNVCNLNDNLKGQDNG